MAPAAMGTVGHTLSAQWPAYRNSFHRSVGLRIISRQPMTALSFGCERAVVRADYRRGGGGSDFFAGFVLGGVVFGALGYLVAPQLTKSISEVAERERAGGSKKAAKYLEDEDTFEDYRKPERPTENSNEAALSAADQKTRKTLVEKIAQLNAAIDDISAQLSADEKMDAVNELEPAT